MKKRLPIINNELFTKNNSKNTIYRKINNIKTEYICFGIDVYRNDVHSVLIHCIWDELFIIEGIQIIFADDNYNLTK
jgi:hypothetical protein